MTPAGSHCREGTQCVLVLLAMPPAWPKIMLLGAALAGFVVLFLARAVRGFYALELPRGELGSRCSSLHSQPLRSWASGSPPAGLAATRLTWEENPDKGVSRAPTLRDRSAHRAGVSAGLESQLDHMPGGRGCSCPFRRPSQ
jgi:hypothetical protein